MKTKNILPVILLGAAMVVSCEDDYLAPRPLSIFVPENIYVDKEGLEGVLTHLRKQLRYEFCDDGQRSNRMYLHENFSSEIAICSSAGASTMHNFDLQMVPTGGGLYSYYVRYWKHAYYQIRDANVVLSRSEGIDWDSEQDKNEVLAEAYFHRAYWYYRLVHQFGDVPFLNREYTEPKIDFYTHSRKTILQKIQVDLEFAVQWLPQGGDPGLISRAAGYHLLTKVYLSNSEFDKAVVSASAVIDGGTHALMTGRFGSEAGDDRFNVIWDLHQAENKSIAENTEGILVTQDRYGYPGASSENGIRSMRNVTPWWSQGNYIKDPDGKPGTRSAQNDPMIQKFGRGVSFHRTSDYFLYEIWKDAGADLRHDTDTNWTPKSKILYNNPQSKYFMQPVDPQYIDPYDTIRCYYGWPHYKVYVKDEIRPGIPEGGNTDWYIFRLAETYLLRAEAYCWIGDRASAANDINKVRERALAPAIAPEDVTMETILDERARELYYEEPRKTELTRIAFIMAENNLNGYSVESFHEKNYWFDRVHAKNYYNTGLIYGSQPYKMSPFHVLWAIPQEVIDSNVGGRINQNMGYDGAEKNITPKTEITRE